LLSSALAKLVGVPIVRYSPRNETMSEMIARQAAGMLTPEEWRITEALTLPPPPLLNQADRAKAEQVGEELGTLGFPHATEQAINAWAKEHGGAYAVLTEDEAYVVWQEWKDLALEHARITAARRKLATLKPRQAPRLIPHARRPAGARQPRRRRGVARRGPPSQDPDEPEPPGGRPGAQPDSAAAGLLAIRLVGR